MGLRSARAKNRIQDRKRTGRACLGYSGASSVGVVGFADLPDKPLRRLQIGIDELDELLGGGVALGSVNLLSGNPGSFKSTLALQVANALSRDVQVVYVSAEEGEQSFKERARRLGCTSSRLGISFTAEVTTIIDEVKAVGANFVVIDSLQAIHHRNSEGGAQAQAVDCLKKLYAYAHQNEVAMIVVCQANKKEQLAGSRELEHTADALFYMKRAEYSSKLVDITSSKNRNCGASTAITLEISPDSGVLCC